MRLSAGQRRAAGSGGSGRDAGFQLMLLRSWKATARRLSVERDGRNF